jgi:hypothetical protein
VEGVYNECLERVRTRLLLLMETFSYWEENIFILSKEEKAGYMWFMAVAILEPGSNRDDPMES